MSEYSVAEAKNRLSDLIERSLNGEAVVITRHGKPVVRLNPIEPPPRAMTREDWQRLYASLPKLTGEPVDGTALIREMRDEGP